MRKKPDAAAPTGGSRGLGAVRLARDFVRLVGDRRGGEAAALPGSGPSLVFVLASSVRVPLPNLTISNGLFPGLAGVVKMLAGEPDEVRARQSERIPCADTGSRRSSVELPRSSSPPAASFITGAMVPVDGGAIPSI